MNKVLSGLFIVVFCLGTLLLLRDHQSLQQRPIPSQRDPQETEHKPIYKAKSRDKINDIIDNRWKQSSAEETQKQFSQHSLKSYRNFLEVDEEDIPDPRVSGSALDHKESNNTTTSDNSTSSSNSTIENTNTNTTVSPTNTTVSPTNTTVSPTPTVIINSTTTPTNTSITDNSTTTSFTLPINQTESMEPVRNSTGNSTTTHTDTNTTTTESGTLTENEPTPVPATNNFNPFDDEDFMNDYLYQDTNQVICYSTLFNFMNNQDMNRQLSTYISENSSLSTTSSTADSSTSSTFTSGPGTSTSTTDTSGSTDTGMANTGTGSSGTGTGTTGTGVSGYSGTSGTSGAFDSGTSGPPAEIVNAFDPPPAPPSHTSGSASGSPSECTFGCQLSIFPIPTPPPSDLTLPSGWERLNFQLETKFLDPAQDKEKSCSAPGEIVLVGKENLGICGHQGLAYNCLYNCTEWDVPTPEFTDFVQNKLLPTAIEIITSMVSVRSRSPTKLNADVRNSNSGTCDGLFYPESLVTNGLAPGKNLYLMVTSRPTAKLDSIAYCLHCNYDYKIIDASGDTTLSNGGKKTKYLFGRPLAGTINFSPKYFRRKLNFQEKTLNFQRAVQATLHEFIHLLGFDHYFYDSYLDQYGVPHAKPYYTKTITETNPSGKSFNRSVLYLNTPTLKKAMKHHFNCDRAMELECAPTEGILSSHFSPRILNGEIMTSTMNPTMSLSVFSIALLQDMGWYIIDPTFSQEYLYGKSQGCGFVKDRCENWNATKGYFCESEEYGCSPDRRSLSFCGVKEYGYNLTEPNQHFVNPQKGGPPSREFCPVFGYNSITKGSFCSQLPDHITQPSSIYDSASIAHSYLALQTPNITNPTNISQAGNQDLRCFNFKFLDKNLANCLQQKCDNDRGILSIKFKSGWQDCPPGGGYLHGQPNETVQIECPSYEYACTQYELPLLIPTGESLDLSEDPEKPWYHSYKFWLPMAGAMSLSILLFAGSIIVYKKYFKPKIAKTIELKSLSQQNSATSSSISDYSDSPMV